MIYDIAFRSADRFEVYALVSKNIREFCGSFRHFDAAAAWVAAQNEPETFGAHFDAVEAGTAEIVFDHDWNAA